MPRITAILVAVLLSSPFPGAAARQPGPLDRLTIRLSTPAEVVLDIAATCEGCSWARAGHEGAVLRIDVDSRPSQHVVIPGGPGPASHRVVLGPLDAGEHEVALLVDRVGAQAPVQAVKARIVRSTTVAPGSADHMALAHSPLIHARPGTLARFSDVPFVMWYATEPTARGTWIRYSVIFSNEDGGTPADKLMARWGRLTDIEYIYGVELDSAGRILAEEVQGPDHQFVPFAGARVGAHPVVYVVTENNMVSDRGVATERFALTPIARNITAGSREVVMDEHAWLYRVSSEEAAREGRVAATARPGSGQVPDPRRFIHVEACGRLDDATIAFDAGFGAADQPLTWAASDGGLADFRIDLAGNRLSIERPNGCFRTAVAAPLDAGPLRVLRWRAYTRPPRPGESPLPAGSGRARLTSITRVFRLDESYLPGPDLLTWSGDLAIPTDGPPVPIDVPR